MSIFKTGFATGLAVACVAAVACGEWLPKHGGIMNQGGETSFELVAKGRKVVLHLEDHGTPLPTAGSRAALQVQGERNAWTVQLDPTGENRLQAVVPQELEPGDRILAKVTLTDGSIVGGRFVFGTAAEQSPRAAAPETPQFRFR